VRQRVTVLRLGTIGGHRRQHSRSELDHQVGLEAVETRATAWLDLRITDLDRQNRRLAVVDTSLQVSEALQDVDLPISQKQLEICRSNHNCLISLFMLMSSVSLLCLPVMYSHR
jgi:hypothetical protein